MPVHQLNSLLGDAFDGLDRLEILNLVYNQSAEGGSLSAETVTVTSGSTKSLPITVTPSGNGAVTVNVDSAEFVGGL